MHVSPTSLPVGELTTALRRVLVAVTVGLIASFAMAPRLRPWLSDSEGFIRWTAITLFATSTAVSGWFVRHRSDVRRLSLFVLAVSVLGLAPQVFYLARAIGVNPPTAVGIEVSGVHDLFDLVRVISPGPSGRLVGIVVVSVGATGVAVAAYLSRRRLRSIMSEHRTALFATGATILLAGPPAMALFGNTLSHRFSAEMAVMTAAGMLVAAALALGDQRRTVAGWRSRIRPWLSEDRPLGDIPTAVPGID